MTFLGRATFMNAQKSTGQRSEPMTPNSALVTDACVAALLRRAFFSAAQRGR